MREFEHHIKDFSAGLRKFKNNPSDSLGLTQCFGLEVKNKSLVSMPEIHLPRPTAISWPFPQYVFLTCCTLMLTRTQILEVDHNWNTRPVLNLKPAEYYSFADFGKYIAGCNSEGQLFSRGADGAWKIEDNSSGMTYITNFKGQAVAAVGRFVCWSAIGRLDFTLDHTNEAGRFPLPWNADVLAVRCLGNELLVFSHLGILELKPVSEPVATFAVSKVSDFGLANAKAIGGNEDAIIFLDNNGTLWGIEASYDSSSAIRSKLKPVELGYKEYFELFNLDRTQISYDPLMQKFYISDDQYCYVLSGGALTKSPQIVTSAQNGFGVCSGIANPMGMIVTDSLDFGLRGLKTLNWLEFDVESLYDVFASLHWRHSYQEPFRVSPWIKLSPRGQVFIRNTALDFRIALKVEDSTDFKLNRITSRIQLSDRRTVRGTVNVSQITA